MYPYPNLLGMVLVYTMFTPSIGGHEMGVSTYDLAEVGHQIGGHGMTTPSMY
jgi:hypothetical protein